MRYFEKIANLILDPDNLASRFDLSSISLESLSKTDTNVWLTPDGFRILINFNGQQFFVSKVLSPTDILPDGEYNHLNSARYFLAAEPGNVSKIKSFRNPSDLHITLQYFGEKNPEQVEQIKQNIERLTNNLKNFNSGGSEYARFGKRYPHLTVKNNYRLNLLNKTFGNEDNFIPHITIGPNDLKKLPSKEKASFPVNKLVLLKVLPKANYKDFNQQMYEPVATYPLQKRNILDKGLDFFRNIPFWVKGK